MHLARYSKVTLFVVSVKRTQAVRCNVGFRNRTFKLQDKSSQYEGQRVTEREKFSMRRTQHSVAYPGR